MKRLLLSSLLRDLPEETNKKLIMDEFQHGGLRYTRRRKTTAAAEESFND